ncbi:MAG: hypothetical protein AAF566_11230 [Pseudomonadota bacterium]
MPSRALWAGWLVALSAGAGHAAVLDIFSFNSPDPLGLQATVDDYRDALGAVNPNNPANEDPGGRRQIDWDAAPDFVSDPNPFPGDFFNGAASPVARGIEFIETGATSGFQLSSTLASGVPVRFGFEDDFVPFSEERMFTPIGGNTFDVFFFDPADQVTPAGSRGLGLVFNDVETAGATSVDYFDASGALLLSQDVEAGASGSLSFLGVIFDGADLARASVTLGNTTFDGETGTLLDAVVVDDVIFGEPQVAPIPLPASVWGFLAAIGLLLGVRRKSRGQ